MKSFIAPLLMALSLPALGYTDSEALQRLGRHLTTIQDHAHSERVIGGSVFLGLGIVGGVGFFIARGSSDTDTHDTLAPILGVAGGLFIVGGILQLAFPTEFERLPDEFKSTPDADLKAKMAVGEDILRRLSAKARRERLIGAGTLVTIGVAEFIWYAASSSTTNRSWMVYNGAVAAGLGVLYFFTPRQPEEEYDAYQGWRNEGRHASSNIRFGLLPTKGLPAPALVWNF